MAAVKGMKEFVHLPQYDSITIKPKEQLGKILSSNVLRFFVDVTGKTKLQTNMQASSLLPHWNTYEARAMRVVISDLPPQFPDTTVDIDFLQVKFVDSNGTTQTGTVTLRLNLRHFVEFKRSVEAPGGKNANLTQINLDDLGLKLIVGTQEVTIPSPETITIDRDVLKLVEDKFKQVGQSVPPNEQIPDAGFGGLIGKFVYSTVVTFFVGEKIMIQVPTWFFPAGAGPYSEDGKVVTHGYPNPQATFQFAEPVKIDAQQNFRVEIEVPESEVLSELQRVYGPLTIWVVLDGYMTRDVQ